MVTTEKIKPRDIEKRVITTLSSMSNTGRPDILWRTMRSRAAATAIPSSALMKAARCNAKVQQAQLHNVYDISRLPRLMLPSVATLAADMTCPNTSLPGMLMMLMSPAMHRGYGLTKAADIASRSNTTAVHASSSSHPDVHTFIDGSVFSHAEQHLLCHDVIDLQWALHDTREDARTCKPRTNTLPSWPAYVLSHCHASEGLDSKHHA